MTSGRYSAVDEDAPAAMRALNQKLHTALSSTGDTTDTAIALALVGHRLAGSLEHTDRIARLIHFLDTGIPPTAQIVPDDEAAS